MDVLFIHYWKEECLHLNMIASYSNDSQLCHEVSDILLIQSGEQIDLKELLRTSKEWTQRENTLIKVSLTGSCLVIQSKELEKA